MSEKIVEGKISFINHEKQYAIIEYDNAGKKKNVNGRIDEKIQKKWKAENKIKKTHHFSVGDVVHFKIKLSDKGDRMTAVDIAFKYNTALDLLIDKSKLDNTFLGYLKVVDDLYFVKEIESYLFFPVNISPWQLLPPEGDLNEQVAFSLEFSIAKDRNRATLKNVQFIPEYYEALKKFKAKQVIDATIRKITPHSIYVDIVGDKIIGKIPAEHFKNSAIKIGDTTPVIISYFSASKIAVVQAIRENPA